METVLTGLSQPTLSKAGDAAKDTPALPQPTLNQFFSAAEARIDRWRTLNQIAKGLAAASAQQSEGLRIEPVGQRRDGLRQQLDAVLAEIAPLEELNGYPGPQVMAHLRERVQTGDWTGLARIVLRVSSALMLNSYRDDPAAWHTDEE